MTDVSNAVRNQRLKELLQQRSTYEQQRADAVESLLADATRYRQWGDKKEDETYPIRWHKWAEDKLKEALDPLPRQRQALEQRERDLLSRWDDREVWVRTSVGEPLRAYHVGPECGRVSGRGRRPNTFKKLLEGEAKARGLRPCSVGACRGLRD
ncbi:hypothetical protein AB0E08_39245 [Streptomyces sp. NPDC048281]|uniref:hypothetical protein n=1 Tax=Streptomyces sp. NPDC048281 TaxID=3154715 RepID=UPI0034165356